jgi:hypothetical protein
VTSSFPIRLLDCCSSSPQTVNSSRSVRGSTSGRWHRPKWSWPALVAGLVAYPIHSPYSGPALLSTRPRRPQNPVETAADPSQLNPNHWVPTRPAGSRSVSQLRHGSLIDQDGPGLARPTETGEDRVDLPRNAQVVGSSPTSGSRSAGQRRFMLPASTGMTEPVT